MSEPSSMTTATPPPASAGTFSCSICGEPSSDICLHCTKDACANHLCPKCHRCSDCCNCEQRRNAD